MLTVFKFCTYYLGDLPMKFLHLADLHLGKRVNGFDLLEDQRYILEQILALCDSNKVDAVVLAGDIYDAPVPPAAACTLLDWFLTQLAARRIAVLAVSGNHDSAERLDYAAGLLANQNVYIAGQFRGAPRQIVLNDRFGPVEFTLLPFVRAATVRHYMPEADLPDYDSAVAAALSACAPSAERRVLVAHQMVVAGLCPPQLSGSETAPLTVGTVDSVDAAHFAGFSYTALGHIHRAQRVGSDTVRYAGAPLCYHLDECGMEKSATLVRLGRRGVDGIDTLPPAPAPPPSHAAYRRPTGQTGGASRRHRRLHLGHPDRPHAPARRHGHAAHRLPQRHAAGLPPPGGRDFARRHCAIGAGQALCLAV